MTEMVPPPIARTWWQRNWKWVVPGFLLSAVATLAAFAAVVHLTVQTVFRSSEVYGQALARVHANAEVSRELGEPLRHGWWIGGSIQTTIASGDADLAIPLSGPSGHGTLYVVARKKAGSWQFEILEMAVAGRQDHIQLLEAEK